MNKKLLMIALAGALAVPLATQAAPGRLLGEVVAVAGHVHGPTCLQSGKPFTLSAEPEKAFALVLTDSVDDGGVILVGADSGNLGGAPGEGVILGGLAPDTDSTLLCQSCRTAGPVEVAWLPNK